MVLLLCIRITWGAFKLAHAQTPPPGTLGLIGLEWSLGVDLLSNSLGDSNVQPRLRTTGVNERTWPLELVRTRFKS